MKRDGEEGPSDEAASAKQKREKLSDEDSRRENELHERIAGAILGAFAALPKTGKPQPNEHTILAGSPSSHSHWSTT